MSQKEAKKIRQIYRKNMRNLSTAFVNDVMKPKPKYFPGRLWYWLMSFFIKFGTEKGGE